MKMLVIVEVAVVEGVGTDVQEASAQAGCDPRQGGWRPSPPPGHPSERAMAEAARLGRERDLDHVPEVVGQMDEAGG